MTKKELYQKCIDMLEFALTLEKVNGHILLTQGMFKRFCGDDDYQEVFWSLINKEIVVGIENYIGVIIDNDDDAKTGILYYNMLLKRITEGN